MSNDQAFAPLLMMEAVACTRGGRLLFEGLDLRLGPGAAAVVTGPNGAGKSSLLRIAAGLLRPAAGKAERSSTALADANLALDERLTLAHALAFWAQLDGVTADAGMEAMGITGLARAPVRILSMGQRKRAMLARVVSSGARLWLLDEPADGLDREGVERLCVAMAKHRDSGGAILAATHQPLELEGAEALSLA